MSVVLVGFMGAGKTTVGRALAERCGVSFVDCDAVVEREHGPIETLFATLGETGFRRLEEQAVACVLAEAEAAPLVVALGGGAVRSEATREELRRFAHVVWLEAPPDDLWRRVGAGESETRPLARNEQEFRRLFEERAILYAQVARLRVASDASRDVATVVDEILERTGVSASPRGADR